MLELFDEMKFPSIGKNPFFDVFTGGIQEKYPPYNVSRMGDDGYLIEVAVPGWDREDLMVSFEDRILQIEGKKNQSNEKVEADYVYKSLSTKNFKRYFTVEKQLDVGSVFLENGLLCIELIKVEPEKPNLLTIE